MRQVIVAILCILALTGCESSTPSGKCVGLWDAQLPGLTYQVSKLNAVVALVFSETIWVPGVVLGWEFYCPVVTP